MQAIKDLIFGEDFKGFGDFKSYENGEKKYNKKRYEIIFPLPDLSKLRTSQ